MKKRVLLESMPKKQVSTSLEQEVFDRLLRIMRADQRTEAQVVRLAIERGVPLMEQELREKLAGLIHEHDENGAKAKRQKKAA